MSKKNQKNVENTETVETPKVEKVATRRIYKFTGKAPENARGQVAGVIKALQALAEGDLDAFVNKVNELDPSYKTKTPMEASVKFHLHQLAKKGAVIEIDEPIVEATN